MESLTIGFAICGSFCTFSKVLPEMEKLVEKGYNVLPIMSSVAYSTDTRFGKAKDFTDKIESICNKKIISTISDAEPIGPKKLLDALIIAPCTGNTAAKLACGICDSSVTMAAKAHMRNGRPLIIAISTNDGLGINGKNIATLKTTKNIFFVPYGQDDAKGKTNSLVADMTKINETLKSALSGQQLEPILLN
ncbi:MAG: dipicolinate synthase subunit B [Oscillospiraceae bacterium]|nr:dipicolinate synthase subunit B [Oscillospiraceae bacterium]